MQSATQRILIKSVCLMLVSWSPLFSQNNDFLEYPYGGAPDSSRWGWGRHPINFDTTANFRESNFKGNTDFRFAIFKKFADFDQAVFHDDVKFYDAQFLEDANFTYAKFYGIASFSLIIWTAALIEIARFSGVANFRGAQFYNIANFESVDFYASSHFEDARFHESAYFSGVGFRHRADYTSANFHRLADFSRAGFYREATFVLTEFASAVDFNGTRFYQGADFNKAHFAEKPIFGRTVFGDVVNLEGANFKQGSDFRKANFDSVRHLYLEDIEFPDGSLFFYWEQFKAKDGFRIALKDAPQDSLSEHYRRVEIIYHQLRDNFLRQGNQDSADDVLYELGKQRAEIEQGFWWRIYGIMFGYGYKPWRYLFFVIIIGICFSAIWYFKYYGIVASILIKYDRGKTVFGLLQSKEGKQFSKRIGSKTKGIPFEGTIFDHASLSTQAISYLHRIWHVMFFSFSILLAVRWKKEWSDINYRGLYGSGTFLGVVTAEYFLGLIFYIVFALLVEGARFDFIKGLLGF